MAKGGDTRPVTPVATIGLIIAVLAALAGLSSGLGYRLGSWPLGTGFGLLRYAAYGAIAAVVISGIGMILASPGRGRRGLYRAIVGLVLGAVVAGVPWGHRLAGRDAPPIHDITTDPGDPPPFAAILPLRAGARNPSDYGGEEIAAQQRVAYPTIQPVDTSLPPERTFDLALATAKDQGWEIVASEPSEGRIEATDTTLWFGFKDDIVIRIRPDASGSRLDIRSTSRVGRGDTGTNAARIDTFLEDLEARIEGE